MRALIILFSLVVGALSAPAPAAAYLLEVDGRRFIDGNCEAIRTADDLDDYLGAALPPTYPTPTCLLEVDGHTYVDGSCDFGLSENGLLIISVNHGSSHSYVAMVEPHGSDHGVATWRDRSSNRVEDLGLVMRKGRCWSNQRARVCAKVCACDAHP